MSPLLLYFSEPKETREAAPGLSCSDASRGRAGKFSPWSPFCQPAHLVDPSLLLVIQDYEEGMAKQCKHQCGFKRQRVCLDREAGPIAGGCTFSGSISGAGKNWGSPRTDCSYQVGLKKKKKPWSFPVLKENHSSKVQKAGGRSAPSWPSSMGSTIKTLGSASQEARTTTGQTWRWMLNLGFYVYASNSKFICER